MLPFHQSKEIDYKNTIFSQQKSRIHYFIYNSIDISICIILIND